MHYDVYSKEGYDLLRLQFLKASWHNKDYCTSWLGVPMLQDARDLMAMQLLFCAVRPTLIIDVGTWYGASALFYATLMESVGDTLVRGYVITIDISIKQWADTGAPLAHAGILDRISWITGDSVDPATVEEVKRAIAPEDRVMVALDSDHGKAHVFRELELYAPLVSHGSYIVVFDGSVQHLHDAPGGSPVWKTDNPARAVEDFLDSRDDFEHDTTYDRWALHAAGGFLRRIR